MSNDDGGDTTPTASSSSAATYESSSLQITQAVSGWFLGPRMENADLVKELFAKVVEDHVKARSMYHPEDGDFVTSEVKSSPVYQRTVEALHDALARISSMLNDNPVPFYSPRYAAHMTFDSSLPSIAGWMTGLLLNPNNISFEAGPLTTLLELEVGNELCRMIGFKGDDEEVAERGDDESEREEDVISWGHLAADGTVANIEAIWAARNLKFYALALRRAMADSQPFEFICKSFKVTIPTSDSPVLFSNLSTWSLLNLPPATVLSIPDRLRRQYGISAQFLENTLSQYIVQSSGMSEMISSMRAESIAGGDHGVSHTPKMVVSATKHYSWAKGVALTGIGSNNLVNIPVDAHARIYIPALRTILQQHLASSTPIYAVVVTIGTTEEGAVDPLKEVLQLRDEFEKRGLCFLVHADAAWGGYFSSTLRDPPEEWNSSWPGNAPSSEPTPFDADYIASLALKPHTVHQLEALCGADSVTVDPHKSGYCPHPIGGLCYKDRRMMHLLTWSAPYVQHGDPGDSIGRHGVEGSKAGAAATAVYMHHSVVGLHKRGHGGLLGEVAFTCARVAAHLATMSDDTTPYTVTPMNPLRFESHLEHEHPSGNPEAVPGHTPEQARERLEQACRDEKEFIRTSILGRSNAELVRDSDPAVVAELKVLGSDLNISAFVCNFRTRVPKGSRSKVQAGTREGGRRKSGSLGEGTSDDGNKSGTSTPRPLRRTRNEAEVAASGDVCENVEGSTVEGDGGEDDNELYEWVLNDDVSEANYLNRRVFDRLSVTDLTQDPDKTPMFISSTIMRSEDYGECMRKFKERAGLETESGVDLYVLRHAVMSPFQTGAGFARRLADTFKEVLEECLKPVVAKNTITPQIHRFVVQGTDRLFLAYQPTFHKANGRQQLILEVEVQDMAQWNAYQAARARHPYAVFELCTRPRPVTIEELLEGGEVPCLVLADQIVLNMTISNARVVKNRSLHSRHRDSQYDTKYTPFYLYGTQAQPHIDHMLLRSPNAQFSAENVALELDRDIPLEKLAAGVLLYVLNRPEVTMQPFGEEIGEREQVFFVPDAEFEVMICEDPFPATAHGPGLAAAGETGHPVISRGTMKLPLNIFVDMRRLNCEDFGEDVRIVQRMEIGMNWEDRSAWSAMIAHKLDVPFSDYLPGREDEVQPNGGTEVPVITTEVSYERD